MTLIIALEGTNYVVIGADSKGSGGYMARVDSLNEEKMLTLSKYCAVLISGNAEIGIELIEEFKVKFKSLNGLSVSQIVKKFSTFCRKNIVVFTDTMAPNHPAFPDFDYIVTGLNKKGRTFSPQTNILRSRSLFFPGRVKNKATEGEKHIADYLIGEEYDRTVDQETMCFLSGKILAKTIKINGNVGGKIKIGVIDKSGLRILPDDNVETYTTSTKEEYDYSQLRDKIQKVSEEK